MNTYKPNTPRYFRLLEKGETRQEGDIIEYPTGELTDELTFGTPVGNNIVFRPVTVDPWISYAERKPTKEDFLSPSFMIHVYLAETHELYPVLRTNNNWSGVTHWKRLSPPTPDKPKSVTVRLTNTKGRDLLNPITVNRDGTAKLQCGDALSAESIEEFIKAREEVMKQ